MTVPFPAAPRGALASARHTGPCAATALLQPTPTADRLFLFCPWSSLWGRRRSPHNPHCQNQSVGLRVKLGSTATPMNCSCPLYRPARRPHRSDLQLWQLARVYRTGTVISGYRAFWEFDTDNLDVLIASRDPGYANAFGEPSAQRSCLQITLQFELPFFGSSSNDFNNLRRSPVYLIRRIGVFQTQFWLNEW
jgi:hypothetical protein